MRKVGIGSTPVNTPSAISSASSSVPSTSSPSPSTTESTPLSTENKSRRKAEKNLSGVMKQAAFAPALKQSGPTGIEAAEKPQPLSVTNVITGIDDMQRMIELVQVATSQVKNKLNDLKASGDSISIGDMFEMQMLMNHLSQLSEMSTAVVSASESAITSMARSVKS